VVVFISNFAPGDTRWNIDAFRAGLSDAGYEDGRNLRLTLRYTEGQVERLPAIAAEIVASRPSVIVASGFPAAHALQAATRTIPVVLAVISDPEGRGIVRSLAQPGANITGLAFQNSQLAAKRLELLRDVVPGLRRVAILADAGEPNNGEKEALAAARTLGFEPRIHSVRGPVAFAGALDDIQHAGTQAVVVLASPMLNANRRPLIEGFARLRLPATWETRAFVEDGGLMSYGPSFVTMYRRSATYVDRILRGEKPADLPMEQPSRFELVINRRVAGELGLTLPEALLLRADDVLY
jgi:putative ABC transport system substrate-binding protein